MANWDTEWLVFLTEEQKKKKKHIFFLPAKKTPSLNVSFFLQCLYSFGALYMVMGRMKNHCVSEPHFVEVLKKYYAEWIIPRLKGLIFSLHSTRSWESAC